MHTLIRDLRESMSLQWITKLLTILVVHSWLGHKSGDFLHRLGSNLFSPTKCHIHTLITPNSYLNLSYVSNRYIFSISGKENQRGSSLSSLRAELFKNPAPSIKSGRRSLTSSSVRHSCPIKMRDLIGTSETQNRWKLFSCSEQSKAVTISLKVNKCFVGWINVSLVHTHSFQLRFMACPIHVYVSKTMPWHPYLSIIPTSP